MSGEELQFIEDAFETNYIAPLGPMVDTFEREFAEYTGIKHCVALSSGTAAMHLALRCLLREQHGAWGIAPGETPSVFASSLTFIGSVTPILFQGASPVLIDCERASWNMDPGLLEGELERCAREGKLPRAVIPTDLYGQCCQLQRILKICSNYGIPVVCDSAEAMGAKYDARSEQRAESREQISDRGRRAEERGRKAENSGAHWVHAGKGARAAVFSFNGNKIITTSGGGMLASDDEELVEHARFLSQQARDDAPHYEHSQIGYNYRMSNILAAIGRGQLRVLDERVGRRREIFDFYQKALGDLPGIEFMPEAAYGRSNRWLTVILITAEEFGADREKVRLALDQENIEARPVWKPMHLQPVFRVEAESSKQSANGVKSEFKI
jgi:dTDP-4-amino-4,6-dideoxygalactose transaminase